MLLLQSQPVIIHLEPPPSETETTLRELGHVFVGALGTTGAFLVVTAIVGVGIACVLYWLRSRA